MIIMEELRLSPLEFKNIIDYESIIGHGNFGTIITYKDKLLKIDNYLFSKIKNNNSYYSKKIIEDYYKNDIRDFDDKKQIEYLSNIQKNVKLTKLPEGIITLKEVDSKIMNVSPGIIIPYHKDYQKLEKLPLDNYKSILIILRKLLLSLRELEENKISQEDLASYGEDCVIYDRKYNVLCKDETPEIIDMDGFYVKVGDNFVSCDNMYREFCNIILDYYYFYGIKSNIIRGTITSYDESFALLKRLEHEKKR